MIDGLSHLMTLRKSGLTPKSTWLCVGTEYVKPRYENDYRILELVAHGSVKLDDFRAFKGLSVTLYVTDWGELATECLDKLKTVCNEVSVLCVEYGDDIGFLWSKEYGQLELGELGWITSYFDAVKRVCRTEAEVAQRIADENAAIAALGRRPEVNHG